MQESVESIRDGDDQPMQLLVSIEPGAIRLLQSVSLYTARNDTYIAVSVVRQGSFITALLFSL